MSILKFAEEFTRLIIRYTRTPTPNNDPSNTITSLTDEEIVYTIYHVLEAISIKGFNKNNNTLSEISNNVNAANVTETLIDIKHESDTEDRSQDVQSVFTDDDSCISEISSKASNKQENSFNELQNEKKVISRSNPAICINNISRSDTFIREENSKINTEDQDDVFEDFTNGEMDNLSNNLQVSLSEIRKSVMDIIVKLNNLEQSFLQSIKSPKKTTKVQQSSLTNGHSSPRCTSIMNKAKLSTNTCKSSPASSKTVISSKLLAKNGNTFERRKSTGGIGINTPAGKSGESKVISNTTSSTCNKGSPGLSVEFQPKFTKNPKYAHIRSTIPKAISQKKKTQLY